jgi:hypothetical protein
MLTQERREELALMVMMRRPKRYGGYPSQRAQNSVAGQLRDENGNKLFPNKKGKQEFAEFLERISTNSPVEGDGLVALSLILFHYRPKMKEYKDGVMHPERFTSGLTNAEAIELLRDEDLSDLNITLLEKLELAELVDWLKKETYKKVAR